MSIFRPALVTALLVVLFSLLLFPIINTFTNNKAISQLLAFGLGSVITILFMYSMWKSYQKDLTTHKNEEVEAQKSKPYEKGLFNTTLRIAEKILFILFGLSLVYLQFRYAIGFLCFYLVIWYFHVNWEKKWRHKFTKEKIKHTVLHNRGYLLDLAQEALDQIVSLPTFFLPYIIDLYNGSKEIGQIQSKINKETETPDYHKGVSREEMERVSKILNTELNRLEFNKLLAEISWVLLCYGFILYLVLQNGGIQIWGAETNLAWYGLAGYAIYALFVFVHRKTDMKFRPHKVDEKIRDSWLTKPLNSIVIKRKEFKTLYQATLVLIPSILLTLIFTYTSNQILGFLLNYLLVTIIWLALTNRDIIFNKNHK